MLNYFDKFSVTFCSLQNTMLSRTSLGTIILFLSLYHPCRSLKNVLFLVVDDFRPEMSAYYSSGSQLFSNIHTPNMDALAAKSLLMRNAYVQQPLCGPSRASFMTGRRPDTTRVYSLADYWRDVGGPFETIPEHFKLKGYRTAGLGKIFHPSSTPNNDAPSWTESYFVGKANFESKKKSWKGLKTGKIKRRKLVDEQVADETIKTLQTLAGDAKDGTANFFIATGFRKPHLPFVFPKRIMDKYYPSSKIGMPSNPYAPLDIPQVAWIKWGELRQFNDIAALNVDGSMNATLPNKTVRQLRRAYYSAVTWIDEQVGRVIDELTNLGLENDTIISLVSDHGFLLGEHGGWCKSNLFELATRVPMMIHIPGVTDSGIVTEELAELVDLFPTLVDAAGLNALDLCPEDSSAVTNCTEGISLIPLISNPATALRNASFSQQPRNRYMGYSIRTKTHRYTEWVEFNKDTSSPDWSKVLAKELYDLISDPEENVNVVEYQKNQSLGDLLSDALHSGWRSAIDV